MRRRGSDGLSSAESGMPARYWPPCNIYPGISPSGSGESLDLADHAVQDLQTGVPEPGVGDVHAQLPDELVRPRGTARGEEFQVVVDEARPHLKVTVVDGEREQVAERVGVDVAGRVQEVADVAPPHLVLVGEDQ